jgi:ribosome maturation factor RimP
MGFKEKVHELIEAGLKEKPELFLVDVSISSAFKIMVSIDGDQGVMLQDCIDLSRAIEHNLDREEQDFSLEVASVGIGTPLKLIRQYKKNIGRALIVKLEAEIIEAELIEVTEKTITLAWEAREPKKIGKGKETVKKTQSIPYEDIKEAIVTVIF